MVLKGPYVWLWMPNILILMACVLQFILSTSTSPSNILSGFANLHCFSRKLLNAATFAIHSLYVFYYRQCLHKTASTVCKTAQKCHWHRFQLCSRPGSDLYTMFDHSPVHAIHVSADMFRSFKAYTDAVRTCVQQSSARECLWGTFFSWQLMEAFLQNHQRTLQNGTVSPKSGKLWKQNQQPELHQPCQLHSCNHHPLTL